MTVAQARTYVYSVGMFNFISKRFRRHDIRKVAQEQLEENRAVLESLRDYDEGKKDISTTTIKQHLGDIRNIA